MLKPSVPVSILGLSLALACAPAQADQSCKVQNTSISGWKVWLMSCQAGTLEIQRERFPGVALKTLKKKGDEWEIPKGNTETYVFVFKANALRLVKAEVGLRTLPGDKNPADTWFSVQSGSKPDFGSSPRAIYNSGLFDKPKENGVFLELTDPPK